MTYETIETILTELDLPYAYYQFKSKPRSIPYVAYFEDEKLRFMADDKVYHFEPHFAVELYTTKKDPELENRLIALFDQHEVPWSGGESAYIESEHMFQTVFYC
jgi:hypothetical protein